MQLEQIGQRGSEAAGARRRGVALWARLARLYTQQMRLSSAHLRRWDVSLAQFDVLAQVGRHEGIPQQELAEQLLVTQGNITQLLDKLEQRGLIRRCPDGRRKRLVLTEAGQRLRHEIVPAQEQFQAEQFGALTRTEQEQLLALLRKLQHGAE